VTKTTEDLRTLLLNEHLTPSSIYDGPYTKTTQFMLPAVNIDANNRVVFKYFVNAYLDDKKHNHSYIRPIFILFSIEDFEDREWKKLYKMLVLLTTYVGDYDCGMQGNKNLVMLVFSVPEKLEKDYYHFKRGKYSKFSVEYQKQFPRYLNDKQEKESILWQIINKSNSLKRDLEKEFKMKTGEFDRSTIIEGKEYPPAEEIWDIPRKYREYYNYE
jgi:hypothetical protein